jgi:hypothetical protein
MNINLLATTFNTLIIEGKSEAIALETVASNAKLNLKQVNQLRSIVGYLY